MSTGRAVVRRVLCVCVCEKRQKLWSSHNLDDDRTLVDPHTFARFFPSRDPDPLVSSLLVSRCVFPRLR